MTIRNPDKENAAVVEYLQLLISQGYIIRMQEVDKIIFIFAKHFVRGDKSGHGKKLSEVISMMKKGTD